MKKILATRHLIIVILGVIVCLPSLVHAFPAGQHGCPFMKNIITIVLGLTDEQLEAFDALQTETRAEVKPIFEEMKELGMEMPDILLAEEIDTAAAEEKLEEMAQLKSRISSVYNDATLERAQILTSVQRHIIWAFAEDALALFEYIADYPGWDDIRDDVEEFIKPFFYDILSNVLGVDFTSDQIKSFDALKDETKAKIEPIAEDLKELRMDMPEILLAEEIDTVTAEQKYEEMAQLKSRISSVTNDAALEAVQILTPEQRQIIKQKIEERISLCPWLSNM
jgi:Spy/CpxP family protein refolding chaperone